MYGQGAQFGDIIVNVDHSGEWDDIEENVRITINDLDQTGTYSADKIGKTAFKSVTFTDVDPVKEKGGYVGPSGQVMYPITFNAKDGAWDDGSTVKKIDIPEGNLISCEPRPKKVGQTCTGWDGDKTANRATTVYAKYGTPAIAVGEIRESWDEILEKGGAGWPIGSYKTIFIGDINTGNPLQIPYEADLRQFPDIGQLPSGTYPYYAEFTMIKVAEGEGGTTSSWVSACPKTLYNAPIPGHIYDYDEAKGVLTDYENSKVMEWLNSVFINWCLDSKFKAHIQPVQKYFKWTSPAGTNINKPIQQRIWLPSVKEMFIAGYDDIVPWGGEDQNTLDEEIAELVTNAIGEEYCNAWLQLADGVTRMQLWDIIHGTWSDLNGGGTMRDMGVGSVQTDMVPMLLKRTFTVEGQEILTSIIDGKTVSRHKRIAPTSIGFCLT